MTTRSLPLLMGIVGLFAAMGAGPGACQVALPNIDLEGLDLGELGGLMSPGMLGALAGLGGLGAARGGQTIVISQPAMVVHGNSIYVAYEGRVTRLDAETLQPLAEGTYWTPQRGGGLQPTVQGSSTGPKLLPDEPPGMPRPPLVPGALPSTGP